MLQYYELKVGRVVPEEEVELPLHSGDLFQGNVSVRPNPVM